MSITLLISAAMGVTAAGGTAPPVGISLGQSRIQLGSMNRGRGGFDRRRRPVPPAGIGVGESAISLGSWHRRGRGARFEMPSPFHFDRVGDRRRRDPGRDWRDEADLLFPWGAGGIAGAYEAVDPYGGGFFAGGGGFVSVRGGRAYYDYDRAYPYEWASAAGGGALEWRVEEIDGLSSERCTAEKGVRVCRGGR